MAPAGRIPQRRLVDSRDARPPGLALLLLAVAAPRRTRAQRPPARDRLHASASAGRRRLGLGDDRPGRRARRGARPGHAAGHPDGLRRAALRRVRAPTCARRPPPARSRRPNARRARAGGCPPGTTRVEYRVDLRQMEREVRAASDQSRVRDGYLARSATRCSRSSTASRRGRSRCGSTVRRLAGVRTLAPGVPLPTSPVDAARRRLLRAGRRPDRDGTARDGARASPRHAGAALPGRATPKAPVDLDRVGRLAVTAFQRVADYFGTVPFAHYTMHQELLTPLTPQHEYGMSMEHLSSSTFYLAASAGLTAASTPADDARVLYNFAHHIAHAWVPKRVLRPRLLPVPVGAGAGARLDLVRRGLRPVRGDHGGGRRRRRSRRRSATACSNRRFRPQPGQRARRSSSA